MHFNNNWISLRWQPSWLYTPRLHIQFWEKNLSQPSTWELLHGSPVRVSSGSGCNIKKIKGGKYDSDVYMNKKNIYIIINIYVYIYTYYICVCSMYGFLLHVWTV